MLFSLVQNCGLHRETFFFVLTVKLYQLKGEITYEVKDPAYCYSIVEVPGDFCSLSRQLTKWLLEVECFKVNDFFMLSVINMSLNSNIFHCRR